MKSNIIVFSISQLVIILSAYLIYGQLSLLGYINAAFFVSALLLFIGGSIYIIRTGAFDFFVTSTRKVLARKGQREVIESMRPPSETFSANPAWFFIAGIPTFALMLLALVIYYI
ncbi:DUF3899 domain-containing protein [Sporosarcina sp. GW1-11]|uniref:DUF3899 domain-containing protein n=1 Tax=Sporosarcina sp. GW1-11 TaxID=2899126 RepID=UPI00294E396E|nr:DUF3899 domain-containing protein [Sporosarcina sp. GW1-11]MDV6378309.1 DUF3899 domain-containing protein [Sporosarcina sp. GW1-11]